MPGLDRKIESKRMIRGLPKTGPQKLPVSRQTDKLRERMSSTNGRVAT
jgi:hypothetical protein